MFAILSAALLRLLDCCHLLPVMLATGLLFAAAWASAAAAPPSPPATLPNYHGCASPIALSHQCVPASDSPSGHQSIITLRELAASLRGAPAERHRCPVLDT
eukprot:COSAG06_NODE_149_length_22026_cov_33.454782_15_plen_102_part_00